MNQETKMHEEIQKQILDSGNRRQFASGAVRDIQDGKGRCDLLPLDIISELYAYKSSETSKTEYMVVSYCLTDINNFIRTGESVNIINAIISFQKALSQSLSVTVLDISKHYEEGARKYAERNWEKGIDCHAYVDSGVRHLIKWADGWNDEPHDRAFLWNMLGLLWTIKHRPECNDLPYHQEVAQHD